MDTAATKPSVFLRAVIIFQFFWCALLILYWIYPFLTSPLDLNYTSGELLDQITAAMQHQLYPILGQEPFRVFNYPPLFLKSAALLAKTGLGPLTAGRLLNLASFSGILTILFVWLKKLKVKTFYAAATLALAGVGLPLVYSLGQVQLQFLATFFSFWGFYLIRDPKQKFRLVIAGLFFSAAAFTKQTELASGGLAFLWLWFFHRKGSYRFLLAYVATLCLFGGLFYLQWGEAFWLHLIRYTTGSFSLRNFAFQITAHLLPWTGFLILGLWLGAKEPALRRDLRWFILIGYLALTLTSARIGASLMYFIPVSLAILLWIGPALETWVRRPKSWIVLLLGLQILIGDAALVPVFIINRNNHAKRQQAMTNICPLLNAAGPKVFSSEPNLPQACGKSLVLYPFIISNLMNKGQFSAVKLIEKIEGKEYPLLIMDFPLGAPLQGVDRERWNAQLISGLRENYRLDQEVLPYYIYRPR